MCISLIWRMMTDICCSMVAVRFVWKELFHRTAVDIQTDPTKTMQSACSASDGRYKPPKHVSAIEASHIELESFRAFQDQ